MARAGGWWWPYEHVAVLTERPVDLHRDNLGRLHRGDGPALAYPDGWTLFAWRGMPIPPEVAAELPGLTVTRIQAETNAEVRRVMLEHFGFERYLRDSEATRLHADEFGVLWRVRIPNDEPLTMVEVVNATPEPDGSRRTYFLRVPPSVTYRARGRGVDVRPGRGASISRRPRPEPRGAPQVAGMRSSTPPAKTSYSGEPLEVHVADVAVADRVRAAARGRSAARYEPS